MTDRIATIIRDWMNKEFNNPDALPSLAVKSLAEEINNHRWEIYQEVREEYAWDDVDTMCENKGEELTEEEKREVIRRFRNVEDSGLDTYSCLIDDVIRERKKI